MELIPYFVVIPLAAAFLMPLLGRRVNILGDSVAVIAALLLSVFSFITAYRITGAPAFICKAGMWEQPFGISFVADGLSVFMLTMVSIVTFFTVIHSISYIRIYTDTWKYFSLLMFMVAGINGVLLSGDIFSLFVFLEIASIATYALVAFGTEARALEASFKYAVMSTVASSFILLGIAFLYSYTSTLNMADISRTILVKGPGKVVPFVATLFLMGFGLKSAIVPFHAWLPDAYTSAPAPVPAMSSGALIKALGVYVIARLFFNVLGMSAGISAILIGLSVASMLVGGFLAIGQHNIRRLLGYSSISQIGFIVLGLGVGTPLALFGAVFHILNHGISKSLLFMASGSVENDLGTQEIKKISALSAKAPAIGYSNLAAIFSICGIPPFGGFWSKLIIILACIQSGHIYAAFIAVIASIITLVYYFKAFTPVIFGDMRARAGSAIEKIKIPFIENAAIVTLACVSIALAFLIIPGLGQDVLKNAAGVLVNRMAYADIVLGVIK